MKPEKIKVNRTLEGTIFEFAFLVLLIAVWVFIIIALQKAPDVVPTHFDGAGHATSYDSKYGILFATIGTVVSPAPSTIVDFVEWLKDQEVAFIFELLCNLLPHC